MDNLTARPQLLKQANLSLIRKIIKSKGTATRAEIVNETEISSTTVRSLLSEMMENGEIQSMGHDESSGGRKAERYQFKPDRYMSAVFCITDNQIHSLLVNMCGEILETDHLNLKGEDFEQAVTASLDNLVLRKEIRSIGIGVPGIVEDGCYWHKNSLDEWIREEIGNHLSKRYHVPVVMENDLNAAAIGFSRRCREWLSCESTEHINMAYLHFEKGCVSAGFIADGRIVRGWNNYAGELGLVPSDNGRALGEAVSGAEDNACYISLVSDMICWICAILNPQLIMLGGADLRKECMDPIRERIAVLLPNPMLAQIHSSPDVWRAYGEGMAYLTAGKMFDQVQFIKE